MALQVENRTLLSAKRDVKREYLFPRIAPIVILAQISICIFAWAFAGLMIHQTIQLPDNNAAWIQNNPNDTQVIVTLLSTILALITSSLLGRTVRYALVRRLSCAPLCFRTMVEWAKLARHSISINRNKHHLSWTLLSVVWVLLLGFLTAAWSSLLAPENIIVYVPLTVHDTNFLDPSVANLFNTLGLNGAGFDLSQPTSGFDLNPETFTVFDAFSNPEMMLNLMQAGLSATLLKESPINPSVSSYVGIYDSPFVSNISTGGIYPPGGFGLPPYYYDIPPLGLFQTASGTEQGFTADVSCRPPGPGDPTITLNITNSVQSTTNNSTWTTSTLSWSTKCSREVVYSTSGVAIVADISSDNLDPIGSNGLLMTSVCVGQGFDGPSNQSFLVILDAPSSSMYYSGIVPQICQVTPQVTTVQAIYDQTGLVNIIQPPLAQHSLPDPTTTNVYTGIMMWLPALAVWTTFVEAQGLTSNMIGESLSQFSLLMHSYTFPMENYLRGMVEYLGSVVRQMLAVIPLPTAPGMTVQSNITIRIHTFGWTFHRQTHSLSLFVITLVTMLTVASGAYAMVPVDHYDDPSETRKSKEASAVRHLFNPTETMDVLLASSAGDLARVLSESDGVCDPNHVGGNSGNGDGYDEDLRVVLGWSERGIPILRVANRSGSPALESEHRGSPSRSQTLLDDVSSVSITRREEFITIGDVKAKMEG